MRPGNNNNNNNNNKDDDDLLVPIERAAKKNLQRTNELQKSGYRLGLGTAKRQHGRPPNTRNESARPTITNTVPHTTRAERQHTNTRDTHTRTHTQNGRQDQQLKWWPSVTWLWRWARRVYRVVSSAFLFLPSLQCAAQCKLVLNELPLLFSP